MIVLTGGYFLMGLILIVLRLFYHIFPKKNSPKNLIREIKNDFVNLRAYVERIFLSNKKIFKTLFAIVAILIFLPPIADQIQTLYILEYFLSALMFFLVAFIFAPQENSSLKGFPIEIFVFTYSIIFMFYSAGSLVVEIFYINNFFKEDVWLFGYIITIISYVVCISTLKGFMERKLAKEEIVLLGMIMMSTLEFITYYGIGFFGGMEFYDPQAYETNIFGDITSIINQGIFIASQSQILERSAMEIWGYIILNGTDVLTITAVLGYLVQKFIEM